MAAIAGASLLAETRTGLLNQYTAEMTTLIRSLQGLVTQSGTLAVTRGGQTVYTLPRSSERRLLHDAGETVQRFFVGADLRSAYADDGVTPLAPFPAMLNLWLARLAAGVARKHSAYLKKHLPPDVQTWLLRRLETAEMAFVGEQTHAIPQYEAAHTWVDPRGYRLSDRIWQASLETRKKIDALLVDAIRGGRDVRQVTRDLEAFLLPGRGLKHTRFFGVNASFDAVRLIRSELARAHGALTVAVSRANPLVEGVDWHLSARHPRYDLCDPIATIGMDGKRLKDPYPADGFVPVPVQHSHPFCICFVTAAVARKSRDVVEQLRGMMERGEDAPLTALDPFRFLRYLIGALLTSLVWREVVGQ